MNTTSLYLLNTIFIVTLSLWLHTVSATDMKDYGLAEKTEKSSSGVPEEAQQEECD